MHNNVTAGYELIEPEHPARAIREVLGQFDLGGFEKNVRAVEGRAVQAGFSPHLLVAL